MTAEEPSDPRADAAAPTKRSVLPVVARAKAGISGIAIGVGAIIAGMLLFGVLDARRRSLAAPAVVARTADIQGSAAPPPLYIPPSVPAPEVKSADIATPMPTPAPAPPLPTPEARIIYAPQPAPIQVAPPAPPRNAGGTALVFDNSQGGPGAGPGGQAGVIAAPAIAGVSTDRARAGMFANRATTVPQGTLIPAVLETAFDSTRPGFARALVQRDVRGFDGTRVLIPRGSRLIGEYGSDAATGQNRALVAWSRLIRPDGVTISVGSPAADPVGRGGIRAKVNSHFFARFSGAVLQSALDIGVNLASRSNNSSVIVALPNSLGGTSSQLVRPNPIPPTLTVAQGTSISVFVARDLDFTGTGGQQ